MTISEINTLTAEEFEALDEAVMETARGLSSCAALARFVRP